MHRATLVLLVTVGFLSSGCEYKVKGLRIQSIQVSGDAQADIVQAALQQRLSEAGAVIDSSSTIGAKLKCSATYVLSEGRPSQLTVILRSEDGQYNAVSTVRWQMGSETFADLAFHAANDIVASLAKQLHARDGSG